MTHPNPRRSITTAHAHTATQSYVFVDMTGAEPTGSVHLPVADIARILQFPEPGPGDVESSLEAQIDRVREYASGHLEIAFDSVEQPIRFHEWRILPHGNGSYVVLEYRLDDLKAKVARSLEVRFNAIVDSDPHREGLLVLQMPRGWGALASTTDTHHLFDSVKTTHRLLLEFPRWDQNLTASIGEAIRMVWRPMRRLAGRVVRALRSTGGGDASSR